MSHEDVLLMVAAIDGIATTCKVIAVAILFCTAVRIMFQEPADI